MTKTKNIVFSIFASFTLFVFMAPTLASIVFALSPEAYAQCSGGSCGSSASTGASTGGGGASSVMMFTMLLMMLMQLLQGGSTPQSGSAEESPPTYGSVGPTQTGPQGGNGYPSGSSSYPYPYTPFPTYSPTSTPHPSSSPTPTASPTSSATPTPTASPTPTATPTAPAMATLTLTGSGSALALSPSTLNLVANQQLNFINSTAVGQDVEIKGIDNSKDVQVYIPPYSSHAFQFVTLGTYNVLTAATGTASLGTITVRAQ